MSWASARSYCQDRGFELATVDSMGALGALLPAMADRVNVWLGLRGGRPAAWYWSLADDHFYQEGQRDYRNFSPSPDVEDSKPGADVTTHSRVTSSEGLWTSSDDIYKLSSSVCYDVSRQGQDRYVLVLQEMTALQAREYCRANHTDLVSIRSPAENRVVQEVAAGRERDEAHAFGGSAMCRVNAAVGGKRNVVDVGGPGVTVTGWCSPRNSVLEKNNQRTVIVDTEPLAHSNISTWMMMPLMS
ncbi:hypothetical protein CRUP_038489 [Coryphaenoides rupestris]|nr:hypothetical protein CRUP_038489 [Coryphaenoides rupestris]